MYKIQSFILLKLLRSINNKMPIWMPMPMPMPMLMPTSSNWQMMRTGITQHLPLLVLIVSLSEMNGSRHHHQCQLVSVSISLSAGLHQHIPISQQHSKDSLDHIIWDSVSTYSTSYILFNPAMWISMAISISRHQHQCWSASAQSNIPARFNEFIESYHMVQCVYLQYTLYIIHWFTEFGKPIWYDTLFCSLNNIIWHTVTADYITDLMAFDTRVLSTSILPLNARDIKWCWVSF